MSETAVPKNQKRNIQITVISIVGVMVLFFCLFLNKILTPREMSFEELKHNGVVTFQQPRTVNDFSLIDQNGDAFDKSKLQGQLNLVFFGFTHCPDICPATLGYLTSVYQQLPADVQTKLQIILVTLDPARDDTEAMNTYINYFNSEFVALTGEFPKIMGLTNNLNVAFNKVYLDDGYTVDHTSHIAVLNGMGDYAGFIRSPIDVNVLPRIIESTLIKLHSP